MTTSPTPAPLSARLRNLLEADPVRHSGTAHDVCDQAADLIDTLTARIAELEAKSRRLKIECVSWKSLHERFAGHLRRAYNVALKAGGSPRHGEFDTAEAITDIATDRDAVLARATQAEAERDAAQAALAGLLRLTGTDTPSAAVSVVATMIAGADASAYGGVVRAYGDAKAALATARKDYAAVMAAIGTESIVNVPELVANLRAALAAAEAREAALRIVLANAARFVRHLAETESDEEIYASACKCETDIDAALSAGAQQAREVSHG
ncbi:hypothetical protein [Azospirillum argentinense]|uniref:Uncharacterized protein n=1 Tax=Azospirillum argentinense TaxID=2970906 RepID=A0A5B0L1S7_9PROT|nr:hypothetical protein [Azospirillum argentinense]KAA1057204.1 hypothetical protein FH063_001372 [Azospirillum argentinense]